MKTMRVLGAVFVAVLERVPERQARQVGDVVAVEFGARPLTDDAQAVATAQLVEPRAHSQRHLRTLRTLAHDPAQLVQPLVHLHNGPGRVRENVCNYYNYYNHLTASFPGQPG